MSKPIGGGLALLFLAAATGAAWGQTLEHGADDPGTYSSHFGAAMAVTPRTLYIGAPNFKVGSTFSRGRTFTYDPATLVSSSEVNLSVSGSAREGGALAACKADVVFGLPGAMVSAVAAGSVTYHREKKGLFLEVDNPFPAADDEFGKSVAIGSKLIVAGAPGDAGGPGAARSGSAFAIRKKNLVPVRLPLPAYAAGDRAGAAVAVSNRYIAVGAPGTVVSGIADQGAVHIYNAKTLAYERTLTGADIFGNPPKFGSALAFSGKYLFVGAPFYDYGISTAIGYSPAAGRVWQYDTRTWTVVRAFNASEPSSSAEYGCAIAADKKFVAIGSRKHYHEGTSEAGKAEVFSIKTGARVADLVSPSPTVQEHYGASVLLLKGNRVAVGAPFEPSTTSDGKVYVHSFAP